MAECHWEALHIKAETFEPQYSLLSPPASPSFSLLESSLSSTSCGRAPSSSLAGTKRLHPYSSVTQKRAVNATRDSIMSNDTPFGGWSHTGSRGSIRAIERHRSVEDEHSTNLGHQFINDSYMTPLSDMRPISSGSNHTSSLTGAVGDPNMAGHVRTRSTVGVNNTSFPNATPELWNSAAEQMTIAMQSVSYPGVAGHGFSTPPDMCANSYNTPGRNTSSPESLPPSSPSAYAHVMFNDPYAAQSRNIRNAAPYPGSSSYQQGQNMSVSSSDRAESEIRHLRRRIQELEYECKRSHDIIESMRASPVHSGRLPPTPPHSSSFQDAWRNRTEARKRIYCSLNRAGNALCAWHDSRRERRMYPPRNAPPGVLNCGCTYDEALFEESLARHGVGSYHPGEMVRMDPALRNPLLKLLEDRYGYKDGDFELDPNTLEWQEGESPAEWEQRAHSGSVSRRRQDADRH